MIHWTVSFCLYGVSSFVRDYLGAPAGIDIEELKSQHEFYKKECEKKDAELAELKKQVRFLLGFIVPVVCAFLLLFLYFHVWMVVCSDECVFEGR